MNRSRRFDLSPFTAKWSCPYHPVAWTCRDDTICMPCTKLVYHCVRSPILWSVHRARPAANCVATGMAVGIPLSKRSAPANSGARRRVNAHTSVPSASCISRPCWPRTSPAQIAGRTGLASHEWIYRHIYSDQRGGRQLFGHLRRAAASAVDGGVRDGRGQLRIGATGRNVQPSWSSVTALATGSWIPCVPRTERPWWSA